MPEDRELIERLVSLPVQIKKAQSDILIQTIAAETLDSDIAHIETGIDADVASDESLTNDIKRRAAKKQRLEAKEGYSDKINERKALRLAIRNMQIDLDFLHNQFRAYQSIALVMAPNTVQISMGR